MKHEAPTAARLGRVEELTLGRIIGFFVDYENAWRWTPLPK